MAITTLEYDAVVQAAAICKKVLNELEPALTQFRELYDAAGGVKDTLTQEDLDSISTFSGLTKQQVDDALYALTARMLPAIEDSTTALAQLAARDRGFAPPPPVMMTPPPVAMAASPAPVQA